MATMEGATRLDPGHLTVLRIRAAAFASVFVVAVAIADRLLLDGTLRFGAATLAAFLLALGLALVLPGRRYRAWSYRMEEDELHIAHGVMTRVRTAVPFGRVQHIDLVQGPLQRRFGLKTLVLNTAGTHNSAVHLPGLAAADAERMRDHIRGKIREDLL